MLAVEDGRARPRRTDSLATEEPMETRLLIGDQRRTVAVTMRTPGSDFELAAGFLFGEGIVGRREEIRGIRYCVAGEVEAEQMYNVVNVELAAGAAPDLRTLERHFYTSSACGVCGKASIDALRLRVGEPLAPGPPIDAEVVYALPDALSAGQALFQRTGGLHAAALFTAAGELLAVREDVGRHNALDKLVGWALLRDMLPLDRHLVVVSGRSSFELVQKCVSAGVPVLCSVSAPSSLAVDLAAGFGMTLIGFLRGRRFNVYAGAERLTAGA